MTKINWKLWAVTTVALSLLFVTLSLGLVMVRNNLLLLLSIKESMFEAQRLTLENQLQDAQLMTLGVILQLLVLYGNTVGIFVVFFFVVFLQAPIAGELWERWLKETGLAKEDLNTR